MDAKRTDPFGQVSRVESGKPPMNPASSTIPEGLDLISTAEGVIIRRVWLTWKIALYAVFAVFWDGFLVVWYAQALSRPHPEPMTLLFPLIHVGVGISITYYVIASLGNKTDVTVTPMSVRIATGPMPWIGNQEIPADEIIAVLVRERYNRGVRGYRVMYADRNRKEKKLFPLLLEQDQAEFVAATIRQTLRLNTPNT